MYNVNSLIFNSDFSLAIAYYIINLSVVSKPKRQQYNRQTDQKKRNMGDRKVKKPTAQFNMILCRHTFGTLPFARHTSKPFAKVKEPKCPTIN